MRWGSECNGDRDSNGDSAISVEARHLRWGLSYRGTSLIRNSAPLGPYSRTMTRAL